jgi:hypothetical protein
MLADQGGFASAYKKLVLLARWALSVYGGDTRSRVTLRQLDAEEIVDEAFHRLLTEPIGVGEVPYFVLRRHVKNHVRSLAKSAKEGHTVRVDGGSEGEKRAYEGATDPTATSDVEKLTIFDDFEFCKKVIFRVMADLKDDKTVASICEAIIAGFRDPGDLRDYANIDQAAFEAAFKRLKRKFGHALMVIEQEEKS